MVDTTTPMHASGSEPVTDANFAARLAATGCSVTMLGSWPDGLAALQTHGVRALALALNTSADSLLFDDDDRGPATPSLRLKLEALDRLDPDEQNHVTALIEGALLRHDARRHLTGQAS